ncbi:hypothetical protein Taro_038900 [Colocasia esculenta]|uniref:Uncharacterized protein n=1 Tax=Colocasia esculenta TaxID=4460 RepID=A0A843WPZ4_COLES|nr:hypothetical protein [Colocasia esculenta]
MERAMARPKRAMGLLDEAARARLWGGASAGSSSSGSERSAELEDLVFDSFYGDEDEIEGDGDFAERRRWRERGCGGRRDEKDGLELSERKMVVELVSLSRRDRLGGRIRAEAEAAWRDIGADPGVVKEGKGGRGWKRRLMWRLREKGFDAGLCKCRSEKAARFPAVAHEYVDVVADGSAARYIVEPNLAAEFEIARPTPRYQELLHALPAVFVGRPEVLRDVVRLMCSAAAESMRSREMHVPPWRRREYVQGKWLGPYKRTTSREPKGGGAPSPAAIPTRAAAAGSCATSMVVGCNQSVYSRRADCEGREGLKGRKLGVGL